MAHGAPWISDSQRHMPATPSLSETPDLGVAGYRRQLCNYSSCAGYRGASVRDFFFTTMVRNRSEPLAASTRRNLDPYLTPTATPTGRVNLPMLTIGPAQALVGAVVGMGFAVLFLA